MTLPRPRTAYGVGHISRWGQDPLGLIEEGARLGSVFGLRLWRPTVLGYSADWNRFVLSDITTFRSKGSMSDLSPYLNAGVVTARCARTPAAPPEAQPGLCPQLRPHHD